MEMLSQSRNPVSQKHTEFKACINTKFGVDLAIPRPKYACFTQGGAQLMRKFLGTQRKSPIQKPNFGTIPAPPLVAGIKRGAFPAEKPLRMNNGQAETLRVFTRQSEQPEG